MSWDEKLFGWAWARGRALLAPRESPEVLARRVALAEVIDRLRVLGTAIAGRPLTLREAEAEGGIAGSTLLLPRCMDFAESRADDERAYVVRVALAASIVRLGLVPRHGALDPVARTLATVMAVRMGSVALVDELPGAAEDLARLSMRAASIREGMPSSPLEALVRATLSGAPPPSPLAARVATAEPRDGTELVALASSFARELGRAHVPAPVPLWGWLAVHGADAGAADAPIEPSALPRGTERAMRVRDHVTRKHLDPREAADNPLVHSFEKLHTLEEHGGGKKQLDGSDELEAHAEALEELDLREVIRSNESTRSLLRSDAMFEGGAADFARASDTTGLPYDEWNEGARSFRRDWCRVHVATQPSPADVGAAERTLAAMTRAAQPRIDAVRSELARLELARRPRARQLDGPEVDEDAMVDRHAALAARATPPDRLHRSRRRHAPDLAVLLLVDASLSTDGWIAGQRVLDVEREATLVLCEALDGTVDELGVASFSSHTRADCRFQVLKGMHEPWARVRSRMMSVEPAGYTRIGPAIRHATTVLERAQARRRLLLVVTDAKPNDYDRYEGRYGVADVAHAVLEADARGIHVHALAMDQGARPHLPRMFRAGGFTSLEGPEALAPAMGRVVRAMHR